MGKRAFERVQEKLQIDFSWGGYLHEGVVKNLSGSGMYIESEICPASGSNIEIVLIVGDESFKLLGKVKRTENVNRSVLGMGVELSVPSQGYCEFVSIVQDNN